MKKTLQLEKSDFDSLHDTIFDLTNQSLPNEDLLEIFNALPQDLKDEAARWGVNDSVVRDNIYVYLKDVLE